LTTSLFLMPTMTEDPLRSHAVDRIPRTPPAALHLRRQRLRREEPLQQLMRVLLALGNFGLLARALAVKGSAAAAL